MIIYHFPTDQVCKTNSICFKSEHHHFFVFDNSFMCLSKYSMLNWTSGFGVVEQKPCQKCHHANMVVCCRDTQSHVTNAKFQVISLKIIIYFPV